MKGTIIAIIVSLALIIGAVLISRDGGESGGTTASTNNVEVVNGVQYIDISAKGGYFPRKTQAAAGLPTVLRMNTQGTFDCSMAVRIPSLRLGANLEPNGTKELDIGTPQAGNLQGTCAMGMYYFTVNFK